MIHGLRIATSAPPISHLLFADDCVIFTRASVAEAAVVKEALQSMNEPLVRWSIWGKRRYLSARE